MGASRLTHSPAHSQVLMLKPYYKHLKWSSGVYNTCAPNCFAKGLFKVNVQAMNAFSASDVDVDLENILQACQNYSDGSLDEYEDNVCRSIKQ